MKKASFTRVRDWLQGTAILILLLSLTLGAMAAAPLRNRTAISTGTWYSLVSKNSGKCVDARASGTANGTVVQQYTCNNGYAQQYQFQLISGSTYRLGNRNSSSQVIDVAGQSVADGGLIQLWASNGQTNQQWQAVSEGGDYYHLVSVGSGKCLDVPGGSTADSVQLQQWACNGNPQQTFQLVDMGAPAATATRTATPGNGSGNLALNKPATASSTESASYPAGSAVDGNSSTTRWSSAFSDPQWLQVDLGATYTIGSVILRWEAAYARAFQIQVSSNASTWTTVYSTTTGTGGTQTINVSGSGRYVRMYGTTRATVYGYSLWEFEVYSASAAATPTAVPTTGGGSTGNFPARFAAPYVETWNNTSVNSLASSTGNKFWTLAFMLGSGCSAAWNGTDPISNNLYVSDVNSLRAQGGDVIISFGGASGTELAQACSSVSSLQAAYQSVITKYNLKWMDMDIEGGRESDTASVTRRNQALHNLQVANPGLRVNYTLAVDRTGLPSAQINLLNNAKANGVTVTAVNIMAMDYGPCYTDMGQAAIDAASATRSQLSANGIAANVGVTPMIGVNDVSCENFTTSNMQQLVTYAQANSYINLIAYWAMGADGAHSYINIARTFH